jgi:predicted nucleic-acid-binding Zn-ribbon protein
MGDIATYTAPNGEVYTNVKAVKTTLGLTVNTIIDAGVTTFPVNIMQPQDVVVFNTIFCRRCGYSTFEYRYPL